MAVDKQLWYQEVSKEAAQSIYVIRGPAGLRARTGSWTQTTSWLRKRIPEAKPADSKLQEVLDSAGDDQLKLFDF